MKYFVKIRENEYEVDFEYSGGNDSININGEEIEVIVIEGSQSGVFNLLVDNSTFSVNFYESTTNGKFGVTINGTHFDVQVVDESHRMLHEIGINEKVEADEKLIRAPMPGLVVKVEVSEGDDVREGEGVVIVEAMKMENELTSPVDGKVKEVKVSQGDSVDKGQILVDFV